jgi:hypothetical protein
MAIMILDRHRMVVDGTVQYRGGPTKLLLTDLHGIKIEVTIPNLQNAEADQVKKGDILWLTIERQIVP